MDKLNLETGDLLLFHENDFWFSKLVEWFTGSQFSHIGMVLKDPEFTVPSLKGLYIMESGQEAVPDSENGRKKFGVQVVPLDTIIENYNGRIYLRKLKCNRDVDFYNKLTTIHSNIHNEPYDTNPRDMFHALTNDTDIKNGQKQTRYWCSALIAYIFVELGFLSKECAWTYVIPKQFSTENPLEFENCELGDEILIHDKSLDR
jgi:hypothetical protein